ncbi:MAG TPA: response regulator [Nitrospira sp.]|nr:response regulator [Nitrospira sp.]
MNKARLISIVDDDAALRMSIDDLIRSAGFRAKGFASAESFLRSPDRQETACLILDVRMPHMNGLELQQHIVEAKWNIPIIFITSFADEAVRAEAMGAGAIDFLYKPFSEDKILNALQKALHQHT